MKLDLDKIELEPTYQNHSKHIGFRVSNELAERAKRLPNMSFVLAQLLEQYLDYFEEHYTTYEE